MSGIRPNHVIVWEIRYKDIVMKLLLSYRSKEIYLFYVQNALGNFVFVCFNKRQNGSWKMIASF